MALNPFDSFRAWLARGLIKAAGLPIVAPWATRAFIEPTFRLLVKEGYEKNAAVFACISALAFSFPEPPLAVINRKDDSLLIDHPLRQLIARPNPIMGEAELMAYTIVYMAIGGNAYWYKVRSSAGRVVELWPYHAGQIQCVPGGDEWIERYDYDPGFTGKTIPIEREDILHFKWPTPDAYQPWQAMPPLKSVARDVDSGNEITRYLFALLFNDAVPRTALILPPGVTLNNDQYDRLKLEWKQKHGGDQRGGMGIIEGGATIQRIGLDMREMAFQALYDVPERHIASAFRVPMFVAGIGTDPIYANSTEARAAFTEQTLSPLWKLCAGEIQNGLADTEFPGTPLTVRYDTSRVSALAEQTTKRRELSLREFQASGITRNEFRSAAGYPAVVGGDVFLTNLSIVTEPAEFETASGARAIERKAKRDASARIAQALQRIRRDVGRKMESDVDSYFTDLSRRVVERAGKSAPRRRSNGALMVKELPEAEDLFTADDSKELKTVIKRWYIEIIKASWATWNTALGVDVDFDLRDPTVTKVLAMVGTRIKDIDDTTLQAVRDLLQYGNEQGWSIDQLVRGDETQPGLRDVVEQTYKNRAQAIARTELGTAQNTATQIRYTDAGVKRVLVLDDGDEDDDEACKRLNGTTQTIAWAAENPLEHPNCTRAFAPIIE